MSLMYMAFARMLHVHVQMTADVDANVTFYVVYDDIKADCSVLGARFPVKLDSRQQRSPNQHL